MTSASAVCSPGLQEAIKQMTLVPHVVMRLSLFLCWIVTSMFLHTCQFYVATITITLLSFSLPFLFVCRISRTISQGSKFHTELLFFSVTGLGVSLSNHKFPFSDCVFHRLKHWFMGNCKIPQRVTIIYLQVNNLC